MSNKKLGIILLAVAAVVVLGFAIFRLTSETASAPAAETANSSSNTSSQASTDTQQTTDDTTTPLTLAEVQKHNTAEDCWTIIDGKVYNITEYVPRHPGGDEILRACGADGSSLFNSRTTSSGEAVGSGTPHSGSAQEQLSQFLVGPLQQ